MRATARGPGRESGAGSGRLPGALYEVLKLEIGAEIGAAPAIAEPCARFLVRRGYSRPLALALLAAAWGEGGERWEERRIAVLLLQLQVLALPRRDLEELDLLLVELGAKPAPGLGRPLDPAILAEGYSSTALAPFAAELRRRLRPAGRLAARLAGRSTTAEAWRDFLARARAEHRLPLARYLFSPAEVVARIRGQVRLSRGVPDPLPHQPADARLEARRLLAELPPYEAEICRRLMEDAAIHWTGDETPTEAGALVACPPGTVVLVVRPPGSDLEIELKRAGRRGLHPLSAVHARDGQPVPPSHRLDGGSIGPQLQWEARSAARLARIYRRVHGTDAPLPRTLSIATVYAVPAARGEEHVLDYLTDPQAFGPGFAAMRREMRRAVAAARRERGDGGLGNLGGAGDLGLTLEFLNEVAPRQALLAGTTWLRLELAARLLAPGGAAEHFAALARDPQPGEARRWVDGILEEVLGEYTPPVLPYASHERHVAAAFAVPANRRRAERTFLDLARQLGRLWGTVAAAGGGSFGESFVGRNVGIRSRWAGGRHRVELVAMDHDRLSLPGLDGRRRRPFALFDAQALDERYVLGARLADGREVPGGIEHLAEVYRAGAELAARGRRALIAAMRHACRTTRSAAASDPELRVLLGPDFLRQAATGAAVVRSFLAARAARAGHDAASKAAKAAGDSSWKSAAARLLERRGHGARAVAACLEAVERHADFLARYPFLFAAMPRQAVELRRPQSTGAAAEPEICHSTA